MLSRVSCEIESVSFRPGAQNEVACRRLGGDVREADHQVHGGAQHTGQAGDDSAEEGDGEEHDAPRAHRASSLCHQRRTVPSVCQVFFGCGFCCSRRRKNRARGGGPRRPDERRHLLPLRTGKALEPFAANGQTSPVDGRPQSLGTLLLSTVHTLSEDGRVVLATRIVEDGVARVRWLLSSPLMGAPAPVTTTDASVPVATDSAVASPPPGSSQGNPSVSLDAGGPAAIDGGATPEPPGASDSGAIVAPAETPASERSGGDEGCRIGHRGPIPSSLVILGLALLLSRCRLRSRRRAAA